MNRWSLVGAFSSLKLTVGCLVWLSVLVFWGTLYQVEHGLFLAKTVFFDSWLFFGFDKIPLPGAQLTLGLLFINLLAGMVIHFQYGWKQLGLILIHMGLVLLIFGGFVIHRVAIESSLTLAEGEGSNVSSSYHEWELSVWTQDGVQRDVWAYDASLFEAGKTLAFDAYGLAFTVEYYFENAQALLEREGVPPSGVINLSGINILEEIPLDKTPERNLPGGVFTLRSKENEEQKILLFGGDPQPFSTAVGESTVYVALRRKRYVLPMVVTLVDFRREMHPNSEVPRHFSSRVLIEAHGLQREVHIKMNEPLRDRGYTLYQASYAQLPGGQETSTLAVVKNVGRLLPYVASVVTFLGLLNHFMVETYRRSKLC